MILSVLILSITYARSTDCFENGVDYFGDDIKSARTRDATTCQKKCQETHGCRYWTWTRSAPKNRCFMKDGQGTIKKKRRATSGPRECPPLYTTNKQVIVKMYPQGDVSMEPVGIFNLNPDRVHGRNGIRITGRFIDNIVQKKRGQGFHIHAGREITNKCLDAQGHFNPKWVDHGFITAPKFNRGHAGDMGNLKGGKQKVNKFIANVNFMRSSEFNILSRTIVLHELTDDLGEGRPRKGSLKTGNAGPRVACGIIEYDRYQYDIFDNNCENGWEEIKNKVECLSLVRHKKIGGRTIKFGGEKNTLLRVSNCYERFNKLYFNTRKFSLLGFLRGGNKMCRKLRQNHP